MVGSGNDGSLHLVQVVVGRGLFSKGGVADGNGGTAFWILGCEFVGNSNQNRLLLLKINVKVRH